MGLQASSEQNQRFVLPGRLRFPPILIIALLAMVLKSLLPISEDTLTFLAVSGGFWATLALFATDMIEKRIRANLTRAGKSSNRRIALLNFPRELLKQGTRLWGFATFMFLLESGLEVGSLYLVFPSTYGIPFWIGLVAFGVASVQTVRIFEFIMNPNYRPRFTLSDMFEVSVVGLVDVEEVIIFYLLAQSLLQGLLGLIFRLLLIVSVIASVPMTKGNLAGKYDLKNRFARLLFVSPFLFLVLYVILVVFLRMS